MNILVAIKQIPDTEARITILPDGSDIDRRDLNYVLNPFDEFAVEEALRLREKLGGKVTLISVGPERAVEAIRAALAMGADEAIRIWDPALEKADPFVIAKALAGVIGTLSFDLILCGKQALDDNAEQVGSQLAEFLNLPQATNIKKLAISPEGKTATVEHEAEGGTEVLELTLPAVLTAGKELNQPRLATLPEILKAKKKEIRLLPPAQGVSPVIERVKLEPPAERAPGKIIGGELPEKVKELVRILQQEVKAV